MIVIMNSFLSTIMISARVARMWIAFAFASLSGQPERAKNAIHFISIYYNAIAIINIVIMKWITLTIFISRSRSTFMYTNLTLLIAERTSEETFLPVLPSCLSANHHWSPLWFLSCLLSWKTIHLMLIQWTRTGPCRIQPWIFSSFLKHNVW